MPLIAAGVRVGGVDSRFRSQLDGFALEICWLVARVPLFFHFLILRPYAGVLLDQIPARCSMSHYKCWSDRSENSLGGSNKSRDRNLKVDLTAVQDGVSGNQDLNSASFGSDIRPSMVRSYMRHGPTQVRWQCQRDSLQELIDPGLRRDHVAYGQLCIRRPIRLCARMGGRPRMGREEGRAGIHVAFHGSHVAGIGYRSGAFAIDVVLADGRDICRVVPGRLDPAVVILAVDAGSRA